MTARSPARGHPGQQPGVRSGRTHAANQWLFSKPTEGSVVRTIELTFTLGPNRRNGNATRGFDVREVALDAVRIGGNIKTPMKIKQYRPSTRKLRRMPGFPAW